MVRGLALAFTLAPGAERLGEEGGDGDPVDQVPVGYLRRSTSANDTSGKRTAAPRAFLAGDAGAERAVRTGRAEPDTWTTEFEF